MLDCCLRYLLYARRMKFPMELPPERNEIFWKNTLVSALYPGFKETDLGHSLSLASREEIAKHSRQIFNNELCTHDVTNISFKHTEEFHGKLFYIGSLTLLESRFALALLGVKHVVVIDSSTPQELWLKDGIRYSSHILPSDYINKRVCDIIESCTLEVLCFLKAKENVKCVQVK